MLATPAWPPKSLPRLFVDEPLARDAVRAGRGQAIISATCCGCGRRRVKLFDGPTGEWLAEIVEAGKKRMTLRSAHPRAEKKCRISGWCSRR